MIVLVKYYEEVLFNEWMTTKELRSKVVEVDNLKDLNEIFEEEEIEDIKIIIN